MWFEDVVDVIRNNQRVPSMHVNGQVIWPFTFDSYAIEFKIVSGEYTSICIDGMGWGDELGYIHREDVNYAQYFVGNEYDGEWHDLTSSEITNACENDGTGLQMYCNQLRFVIDAAGRSTFNAFCFKTPQWWAPTVDITVSVIGYRIDKHEIVLASKTITQAANTLYVLTRDIFD